MSKRRIKNHKKDRKTFTNTAKRTKKINTTDNVKRGGIRL